MIRIEGDNTNFFSAGDGWQLIVTSDGARGVLSSAEPARDVLDIRFVPSINGEVVADFVVSEVCIGDDCAQVVANSAAGPITIHFEFHEKGFVYRYELPEANGIVKFQPGAFRGSFSQVENFDPDLERFDIPERITTPVQIASRRRAYDGFWQLDWGNYVIPPYLLALRSGEQLVGFGLADVPETQIPIDATLSISQMSLSFDHGSHARNGQFTSPRVAVCIADSRTGVLDAYRESIRQACEPAASAPPAWVRDAIYTSWGDQVYAKHLAEGAFTSEVGSEKYLTCELVDSALAKLAEESIFPKTIVLDEGWSVGLGDWDADDARLAGSLKQYIAHLQSQGRHVVLYFNPFLVVQNAKIVREHPEFLLRGPDGERCTTARSGREHFLFDWSCDAFREYIAGKVVLMLSADGLNADGLKVSGTKFLPPIDACLATPAYGLGERYLQAVLQDIRSFTRVADPAAAIFLACLNPLLADCFDVVRMGNTSEVNHDLHVQRAQTASWLLPDKPIDTDDWASYQKVIGATTFIKAVTGAPNVFSAFHRGDGRLRFQGAMGGCPVQITPAQYRTISAAWKLYEFSLAADRSRLSIDYDRMEFATAPGESHVRTYQGGNVLAVYTGAAIYAAALLDGKVILDIPADFTPKKIIRYDRAGQTEKVAFQKCLTNKMVFEARSSRDETWYYEIKGA